MLLVRWRERSTGPLGSRVGGSDANPAGRQGRHAFAALINGKASRVEILGAVLVGMICTLVPCLYAAVGG